MPTPPFVNGAPRYESQFRTVAGVVMENYERVYAGITATPTLTPTAGTLYLSGLLSIPAGTKVTGHGHWFVGAGTGATTIRWGCLVRVNPNQDGAAFTVIAVSANSTAAFNANALNNFVYSSAFTPIDDAAYMVGTVITLATTQPTIAGINGLAAGPAMQTPMYAATANTALTATPLAVGTALAARTAVQFMPYAYMI